MAAKKIFQTMDGLRGVAALAIVAFHSTSRDFIGLKYAYLSVDFFFVLSGFVIAHAYDERLRQDLSFKDFIVARFIRLYPLYILGTFISIFVIGISFVMKGHLTEAGKIGFHAIPSALLMLPASPLTSDWTQAPLYPLDGPAWSLLFELIVNVLYAMSVRIWTESRLLVLMGLAASISIGGGFYIDGGWNWSTAHVGLLRVFYSFPAGVLIFKLYTRQITFPSISSLAIAIIFLGLVLLPYVGGVYFSILLGFPLVVAMAANSQPKGRFLQFFSVLGAVSYAIYAIHEPVHVLITASLTYLKLSTELLPDLILIALIVPICIIISRSYDAPVRNYLTRQFLHRAHRQRPLEIRKIDIS